MASSLVSGMNVGTNYSMNVGTKYGMNLGTKYGMNLGTIFAGAAVAAQYAHTGHPEDSDSGNVGHL